MENNAKKQLSPFFRYLSFRRPALQKICLRYSDIARVVAGEWRAMDEVEKKKWSLYTPTADGSSEIPH